MELDDFKKAWRNPEIIDAPVFKKEELQKRIYEMERAGMGIRAAFLIEMAVIVAIYAGFFALLLFAKGEIQSYMYKLVLVTSIGGAPVCYRLYHSQRLINSIEYSGDIRSNLVSFLTYYKKTLRLYRWASYGTTIAIFVLFFTDDAFLALSPVLKIAIAGYITLFSFLTGPYINRVYGKKAKSIEEFLSE